MSAPETPPAGQDQSEPDSSHLSDEDSACGVGGSRASSTTSLRSSTLEYPNKYGRTYHAYRPGAYKFPNDLQEQYRLDLQHELYRCLLGEKLYLAPILTTPQHVLDVGTGSGLWAMDFADRFPSANVIGIDLSPIQPTWIPQNCEFVVDDARDDWKYFNKFDFVHCRQLHMSVEERRLFRQSYDALKPGAWFEVKEIALPIRCLDKSLPETDLAYWGDRMMEASRRNNTAFDNPYEYRHWMEEAGFVNVEEQKYPLPLNPWPKNPKQKELGHWQMANLWEGIEGFSLILFTEVLGWTRIELEDLLANVRRDIPDRRIHAFVEMVAVIGQKPY